MSSNILRLPILKERTGLSRSTIYAMIKKGEFPAPILLSVRCVGWLESDLNAWLEKQIESKNKRARSKRGHKMIKRKSYIRKHNLHKIPRFRTYTAGELSKQLGVNISTARGWIKNSLSKIDKLTPYLVHGTDLIEYLTIRQSDRKQKLEAGQFYCMKCRNARYADIHSITHTQRPNKTYSVTGKCEVCFMKINRLCKPENLSFL